MIEKSYNQDFEAVYCTQKVGLWGIDGSYDFLVSNLILLWQPAQSHHAGVKIRIIVKRIRVGN